jgi:hypothetical protein
MQGGSHKVSTAAAPRCSRESKAQRRTTRTQSGFKVAFASFPLAIAGGAGHCGGACRQARRRGGGAVRLCAVDCRQARLLIVHRDSLELGSTLADNARVGGRAHNGRRSVGACM